LGINGFLTQLKALDASRKGLERSKYDIERVIPTPNELIATVADGHFHKI
jgi:hypothetical protein